MNRQPMTPEEFDANCRIFEARCHWTWATSGYRCTMHNVAVGGAIASKHAMLPCMARDYGAKDQEGLDSAAEEARKLGFWLVVHNVGSGDHLHLQGLAPGAPPEWWLAKYGG